MFASGNYRQQIVRRLNAAYAGGLLSEDTFIRRVDELFAATLVEPAGVAGDLHLRASPQGWRSRLGDAVGAGLDRLAATSRVDRLAPSTLLALDWSGSRTALSIGRHRGCDIVLEQDDVSRRHALLRFRDGRWILQDLESTNGTFVNGVRVGRCELRAGDHLLVGGKRLTID